MAQTRDILIRPPTLAGPWVSPIPRPPPAAMFLIPWSPAGYEPLTSGQGEQGEALYGAVGLPQREKGFVSEQNTAWTGFPPRGEGTVTPLAGVPRDMSLSPIALGGCTGRRRSKRKIHLDELHTHPGQQPLNTLCP